MAELHINRARYTFEEEQLIKKYYPKGLNNLEKLLPNRNRKAIILKAMLMGLSKKNNSKWSDEEIKIIKENYSSNGSKYVQTLLPSRSIVEIQQKAFKLKIKFSEYNENYFENIDSSDKAYFLGLFYTDGYVTQKGNRVGIELNKIDKYILEKFLLCINSNLLVKDRIRKNLFKQQNKNELESCMVTINNKKLHTDLIKLGCIPIKSKILKMPNNEQLPEKYFWHFLRGVIDGDGSVGLYNGSNGYKKPHVSLISASKEFVEEIQTELLKRGIDINITIKNNLYRLMSEKQETVFNILQKVYYESDEIRLLRKYNHYLDICKYFNIKL